MIKKREEILARLRGKIAKICKNLDCKYNKNKYFFICYQCYIIDRENPWQCKECTNPPIYIF